MATATLGSLRAKLQARCGFGAAGAAAGVNLVTINSFLQEAQTLLYWTHDWARLRRYKTVTLGVSQYLLDYPSEANPDRIKAISVLRGGTIANIYACNSLRVNGTNGAMAQAPDAIVNRITGDITLYACIKPTTVALGVAQNVISKWDVPSASREFALRLSIDGRIQAAISPDGTAQIINNSDVLGIADGTVFWIKADWKMNNGEGGNTCTFYYSLDPATTARDSVTWKQIGSPAIQAGVASIFGSALPINIGIQNNAGTANGFSGAIYRTGAYSAGTLVIEFNANDTVPSSLSVQSRNTSDIWTLAGQSNIQAEVVAQGANSYIQSSSGSSGGVWSPPLTKGITPQMYTTQLIPSWPQRWEPYAQIEMWPVADQSYPVRIFYVKNLGAFEIDTDYSTIDSDLIFEVALGPAKAHYRHPDAPYYTKVGQALLDKLKAKSWGKSVFNPNDWADGEQLVMPISPPRAGT